MNDSLLQVPVQLSPTHDRDALRFARGEAVGIQRANAVLGLVAIAVLVAFVVVAIVRGP